MLPPTEPRGTRWNGSPARSRALLSFKSYASEDGEVVALSEWTDEASAIAWRNVAEHRAVQARGRSEFYAGYTLFACDNPRIHRFTAQDDR